MKNKMYSDYDNECIVYLTLQIYTSLLKDKWLYIDLYYEVIKEIYEDYKKYDNNNTSLLNSINTYIDEHKDFIMEKMSKVFE